MSIANITLALSSQTDAVRGIGLLGALPWIGQIGSPLSCLIDPEGPKDEPVARALQLIKMERFHAAENIADGLALTVPYSNDPDAFLGTCLFTNITSARLIDINNIAKNERKGSGDAQRKIAMTLLDTARVAKKIRDIEARRFFLNQISYKMTNYERHIAFLTGKGEAPNKTKLSFPDCFSQKSCQDIDLETVPSRAFHTAHLAIGGEIPHVEVPHIWSPEPWKHMQEVFRFRQDDPRQKCLIVQAENDHNNAFSPFSPKTERFRALMEKYDVKYAIVKEFQEICDLVASAARTGKLAHVIIRGHGSPRSVELSSGWLGWPHTISTYNDFSSCFLPLDGQGRIVLESCSTGADQDALFGVSLAQHIASTAKRAVVANRFVGWSGDRLISIDPPMMDSPRHSTDPAKNPYRIFYPGRFDPEPLIIKSIIGMYALLLLIAFIRMRAAGDFFGSLYFH